MENTTVTFTGDITLSYDKESPEFKESLESYLDCIDNHGNERDMLIHVAHNVVHFDTDSMVDGVGYVGVNGKKPDKEPFSGIYVSTGYDDFDYEIE